MNDKTLLFVISIDTEIDKSPDWSIPAIESFLSVTKGIPQSLTPLFDGHGVKPTYLLSPEVMRDGGCMDILKTLEGCELGTHLHGEFIEPCAFRGDLRGQRTSDMQCSYPELVEEHKLANLTALFERQFGVAPTSFRAGRFGADHRTIGVLEKMGYLVDSSVTPGIHWSCPEGDADFRAAPSMPYFPDRSNLTRPGESRVLEVPVSIVTPRLRRSIESRGLLDKSGPLRRGCDMALPNCWIRPSHTSSRRMIWAIKELLQGQRGQGPLVINMMFHSMEVIPNASPVNRSEGDVKAFLSRMSEVIRYVEEAGFSFATLTDVYRYFQHDLEKGS